MMQNSVKVSVILPVYNVEAYIKKCLETLQSQTLKELEFIFIDDKSPDNTIAILENAAKEDGRIIILRNERNMGPGPSRNRGIEIARGEYLNFMDPDDYVDLDFYEVLYDYAKEKDADVVKGHVTAVDMDGNKVDTWNDASAAYLKLANESKPLFACNKSEHFSQLFRRSFILSDDKVRYADTMVGEDSVFLARVNLKEPTFYLCNDTEYYHLIRGDSLEGNISFENCKEGIRALKNRIEVLEDHSFPDCSDEYLRGTLNYYIARFNKVDEAQKDESLRREQRTLFKETLDAALSRLPESVKVTDGLRSYEGLTDMVTSCIDDVLISIIIPVYNVKPYLVEALDSVRDALRGIASEVICVDDGSDDGTSELLDKYVNKYPHFVAYHTENGGAAAARNYGLERASGKYIAFIDADDRVTSNMYKDMLYVCEANALDLCICNVTRFEGNNKGVVSGQYQRAFSDSPKLITSLEESLNYVYDGAPWNKLIRKEFWDKHRLEYPRIKYCQDMPVALQLFCTAERFGVLQSFDYYWRVTPGANSLSQQVKNERRLEDRITVCKILLKIVEEKFGVGSPATKAMIERFLCWEFDSTLWHIEQLSDEDKVRFCDKIREFYREVVPEGSVETLPIFHRKRYDFIMSGDVDQLVRLMNHRRIAWRSAPIIEKDGKHYLKLPEDIYGQELADASVELQDDLPLTRMSVFTQNGPQVKANIVVYQPRVNVPTSDSQEIKYFLYNEHTGQRIYINSQPLKVEPWTKTYGTMICNDDYRVYNYNYDWAGTIININFDEILKQDEVSREILDGDSGVKPRWLLFIEYKTPVLQGYRPVRGLLPKARKTIPTLDVTLEHEGKKYKYEFVHDMRETLYIELNKL